MNKNVVIINDRRESRLTRPHIRSCRDLSYASTEKAIKCSWDVLETHGTSDHFAITSYIAQNHD